MASSNSGLTRTTNAAGTRPNVASIGTSASRSAASGNPAAKTNASHTAPIEPKNTPRPRRAACHELIDQDDPQIRIAHVDGCRGIRGGPCLCPPELENARDERVAVGDQQ